MWFNALAPITDNTATLTSVSNRDTSATSAVRTIRQLTRIRITSYLVFTRTSTSTPGQQAYLTPGTYQWTAPAGVTLVSVVCVGGGGGGYDGSSSYGGGGGGGLGWKNNIPVTPGQTYTVVVGTGGPKYSNGGNSYFISLATVSGYGGGCGYPSDSSTGGPNASDQSSYGRSGGWVGDGGGAGGNAYSSSSSGAGAGGYYGQGGYRGSFLPAAGSGAGAQGARHSSTYGWGAGGGVSVYGFNGYTANGWWMGSSGQYDAIPNGYSTNSGGGGKGGSGGGGNYSTYGGTVGSLTGDYIGGGAGMSGENPINSSGQGGNGGLYGGYYGGGGGGCGDGWPSNGGIGGRGAVRIIWGGGTFTITSDTPDDTVISIPVGNAIVRAYPQTNTTDV